jgi:hypothetical protein
MTKDVLGRLADEPQGPGQRARMTGPRHSLVVSVFSVVLEVLRAPILLPLTGRDWVGYRESSGRYALREKFGREGNEYSPQALRRLGQCEPLFELGAGASCMLVYHSV